MPYFYKENEVNTLLVHIPKTGGTSLEMYFSNLYKIELNVKSLMFTSANFFGRFHPISRQHYTYNALYKLRNFLKITFDDTLKIVTAVRNPYDRIISDLFYLKMIDKDSTKEKIFTVISSYLKTDPHKLDNHNLPQYKFLIDENGKIDEKIIIMKTESLHDDMKKNGFENFDVHELRNATRKESSHYLNQDSINMINAFYDKDFQFFNYEKILF